MHLYNCVKNLNHDSRGIAHSWYFWASERSGLKRRPSFRQGFCAHVCVFMNYVSIESQQKQEDVFSMRINKRNYTPWKRAVRLKIEAGLFALGCSCIFTGQTVIFSWGSVYTAPTSQAPLLFHRPMCRHATCAANCLFISLWSIHWLTSHVWGGEIEWWPSAQCLKPVCFPWKSSQEINRGLHKN